MRALMRIVIVIPMAYLLASLAAGYLIYSAWQISGRLPPVSPVFDSFELVLGGFFMSMMFATIALPLSTIAIITCELMKVRGFLTYTLVGLAHGMVLVWMAADNFRFDTYGDAFFNNMPEGAETYLAGGAIWGIAYWIMAGRLAGFGFERTK
ncbi:MAG: hypothetical protein JKY99_07900 [Rhizobiales bacterium]|nr:hypothetical protein [Hyphomicrobiales bacterium]